MPGRFSVSKQVEWPQATLCAVPELDANITFNHVTPE